MPASRASRGGIFDPARTVWSLLAAGVGTLWLVRLQGSLWVDEFGTYWVVKDGLRPAIDRAWDVQGQSPLFYIVEWLATALGGRSEWVMRLPSLAAMGGAAYLFFLLVRRLMGHEAAVIATVIFAMTPAIGFFASDARPYALAMLMTIASTLFLVRWLDMQRRRDGVGYVVFAALTVYAHYIFALVLLTHAVYAVARRDRVRRAGLIFAAGGTVALLVPVIPHMLSLLDRSGSLSVPAGRADEMLLETFAPPALIGGAILGAVAAHLIAPLRLAALPAGRATIALGAAWLVIAPSVLFAISALTPVTIFADRYLVTASPGFAILGAAAVSAIASARARVIILAATLASVLLVHGTATHTPEDWRGAIAYIDARSAGPGTPVLVHAALIESEQIAWLTDPQRTPYLNGPTTYYRVDGRPLAMPFGFNDASQAYLERLLPDLRASVTFFYVTRYASVATPQWLLGRLAGDGFRFGSRRDFGGVRVFEFRRD